MSVVALPLNLERMQTLLVEPPYTAYPDLLFVGVGYIPLSHHIELVLKSGVMELQMSTIP